MPRIGNLRAAVSMHFAMLYGILRSPSTFFDSTPVGRILGRFSKDIEEIDNHFDWYVADGIYCFFEVTAYRLLTSDIRRMCRAVLFEKLA